MTFAELFTTLESRGLIPKRAPAKKSSLTHLAKALGYPTLDLCPVGEACRDPSTWTAAMHTYFAARRDAGKTMTAHNRDNILTDLRGFFKLADAQGLLTAPLPVRLLKPTSTRTAFREQRRGTSPYQATYSRKPPYRLPQARWPDDIQAGWHGYTDRLDRRVRDSTLRTSAYCLETFFGYVAHVYEDGSHVPTWDDLFRVDLLRHFVRWHAARLGRDGNSNSAHGVNTVRKVAAIAKVLELDKALPPEQSRLPPLVLYARKLKQPDELRQKARYHWTELPQIEAVANSLLAEGRVPCLNRTTIDHPGAQRAVRFQLGLILKLFVRVPLRQRNVRELQWPKNLWQDPRTGEWTLRFEGDELKVGRRKGKVNVFEVRLSRLYPKDGPTPDDFIPTLEEFINVYRPLLPNGKPGESPFLFLTQYGNPYSQSTIAVEVRIAVERRIGVKLNPHLIRDIAGTALLKKTKDYDLVAALLGNTVQMVMQHYAHLIPEEEMALAAGHLGTILRTG